jgi:excinuclease ABC subunit C
MPQRGDDVRLLKMANDNAKEALRRQTLAGAGANDLNEALQMLRASLGLTGTIARIEAFDISHMQGSDQAAGMVVFQDGRPRPSLYRHFAVDEVTGADDVAALTSVVRRRLSHLKDASFGSRPDLLLIDGGRLQVEAIAQLLRALETDIPVAGMVKDDRHRTRGLVRADGQILELRRPAPTRRQTGSAARHLLRDSADLTTDEGLDNESTYAGQPDTRDLPDLPLLAEAGGIAPEDLALLRLLTAIQDEAHRFAGQYRQKRTKKRQTRFTLEGIPGIGPARRKALLTRFSSITAGSEAEEEAIAAVPGVGSTAAKAVYRHFHPERGD